MTRQSRVKSNSGYYHIMLRGNGKKNIFYNDEDRKRFMETIYGKKHGDKFYLHAFCLMNNHIHLMISEGIEDVARVMKRITVSYVYYFNKKYKRVGHLFQDRFKSEVVEHDNYVLSLARYIHQNPVKAGLVEKADDYIWSSHNCYLGRDNSFSKGGRGRVMVEIIVGLLRGPELIWAGEFDILKNDREMEVWKHGKDIIGEMKAVF